MVFLSIVNFVCKNGYDRTLKVRKVLKLTGVKYLLFFYDELYKKLNYIIIFIIFYFLMKIY